MSVSLDVRATPLKVPDCDIRLAANLDVPVLVTSADGDERAICARLIHATRNRGRGPFVTFSRNGVDALVARSKLLKNRSEGVLLRRQFGFARGGTLFIDDIVQLTANAQAHLLALLDERVPPPASIMAAVAAIPGVRVIAGASRHLDAERAAGAFCEPLFYRLNVVHLDLTDHPA